MGLAEVVGQDIDFHFHLLSMTLECKSRDLMAVTYLLSVVSPRGVHRLNKIVRMCYEHNIADSTTVKKSSSF